VRASSVVQAIRKRHLLIANRPTIYRELAARIQELDMKKFGYPQRVLFASLLIAAPAFAQAPQTQKQTPAAPAQTSQAPKQKTDGNSPTMVGPASGAYKQKTQGDLPEVGPASGAYNGNVPRSKY
jgi:hypothetical protein